MGIDLGRESAPDETMACKGGAMLEVVNRHLEKQGVRISTGTIVGATIIPAPSSTKNQRQERDPEMHRPRKAGSGISG